MPERGLNGFTVEMQSMHRTISKDDSAHDSLSHGGSAMKTLAAVVLLLLAGEREASAYTDPGSGALIWQMLMAGFVGGLFYVRRFTAWFRGKRGSKD